MADNRDFQIKDYIQQPIVLNNKVLTLGEYINNNNKILLDKIKTFSTLAVLLDNKQFKEVFDEYFKEYIK